MGGIWKLAAMSAVIGAGLVIVWQAQQGLNSVSNAESPAPETEIADSAPVQNDPSQAAEPEVPALNFTPILSRTSEQRAPRHVAASVAPEEPAFAERNAEESDRGPVLGDASSESPVRYQRGIKFKAQPKTEDPFADQAANTDPQTTTGN